MRHWEAFGPNSGDRAKTVLNLRMAAGRVFGAA